MEVLQSVYTQTYCTAVCLEIKRLAAFKAVHYTRIQRFSSSTEEYEATLNTTLMTDSNK